MESTRSVVCERIAALVPVCLAVTASALAWSSSAAWFGRPEQVMSVIAVVGTIASAAAIFREDVRVRIAMTCLLLLGAPALRVAELLGHSYPYIMWDHGLVASIVSLAVLFVIVGLVRRREWGRWIGLGGSLAGLGGSVLNGIGSLAEPGMFSWAHACATAGCASLVLLLTGPSMRDAFEGTGASQSLWRSSDRVIVAIRWTLISTLVSTPMLIVYAHTQAVVPDTAAFAWALAGVQIGATVLCLMRKVAGALLLSGAGAALLVFTLVCMIASASDPGSLQIMGYYAVFWGPAGIASVIASAVMLRPLRALLRDS